MGTAAFNGQGHGVGIVTGHRDDHDAVISADSVREILSRLETLGPSWQPGGITVTNLYEHGYWRTWPEFQAEHDEGEGPFLQVAGAGSGQDKLDQWFQASCDISDKRSVTALTELPLLDEDFIPSEGQTWTPVKLVIDGKDLGTDR